MSMIDKLAALDEIEAKGDIVEFLTALGNEWPTLREALCRRNDQVRASAVTKSRIADAIFKTWTEREAYSESGRDDGLVLIGILAALDYFIAGEPPAPATPTSESIPSQTTVELGTQHFLVNSDAPSRRGEPAAIVAGVTHCTIQGEAHCFSIHPRERCRGCPLEARIIAELSGKRFDEVPR